MKINRLLAVLLLVICLIGAQLCMCACNTTPESSNDTTNPPDETEDNIVAEQKIARVVVMFGQSNMEGCSYKRLLLDKGVSKTKYEEYLAGYSNVKISYVVPWNPAQSSRNSFIPTALGMGGQDDRFGPEVGIAEYLTDKGYQSVFLVKYSFGGTSLHNNWRSPSSGGATGALYTGAVEYVLNAMKVLENMDYYPVIDAICWMQGESDADGTLKDDTIPKSYFDLQKNFMADLRDAFAYYGNVNGIGFVDAGISACPYWKYRDIVNGAKYTISQLDDLNSYFATDKLEYKSEPSYGADDAHYDCLSEIELGHLFGQHLTKYLDRSIEL